MNEQLIVKNFGPIKDATVDFKRVTVFIGPTGGGKSTLAKLAAIFRNEDWQREPDSDFKASIFNQLLNSFLIFDYLKENGKVQWQSLEDFATYGVAGFIHDDSKRRELFKTGYDIFNRIGEEFTIPEPSFIFSRANEEERKAMNAMHGTVTDVYYIPADRAFISAIDSGLAGLTLKGIALPETLLTFTNEFKLAQNSLQLLPLEIPFLKIDYRLIDKQAQIDLRDGGTIELSRGASGIQAVAPMMLVINHAVKRRSSQVVPYSFIIEEPELNLYPTAQQGLLNWLVEKCTKGENDLTITTHSPYILSHLNLLLYAHHVGTKDEEKRRKVAAIIPEQYWLNPDEFAAYYVNGPEGAGGVRSLLDPETKLISQNELDAVSGVQADEFDQLLDINRGF